MFNPIEQLGRWIKSSGFVCWVRNHWNRAESGSAEERTDGRHKLGLQGERIAVAFLKSLGYRVLAHGHRKKLGEIDIIAVDSGCIVFVEVKTWRSDSDADPSAAVDARKQDKITRTALVYLKRYGLLNQPARFDVISIVCPKEDQPKIRHFKSAFEASGRGQLFR